MVEEIGNIFSDRPNLTPAEQSALDTAQLEELQIASEFTDKLLGNIQWRVVMFPTRQYQKICQGF